MKALYLLPFLAACAASPENIEPVAMSSSAFTGVSCSTTAAAREAAVINLAILSDQQRETAELDAGGVFMLGLPVGSMYGGDKAPEIASLKGQIAAMDARLAGC